MKINIYCLFFFLVMTQICFGQWYQQDSPTKQNLNAVTFIDVNNGFAVGDSGIILQTTNGGTTWLEQTSGTNLKLFDICFTDTNNGWVVGGNVDEYGNNADSSVILHSSDGGISWLTEIGGTGYGCFYDCSFTDTNFGTIVGCYKDSIGGAFGMPLMLRTSDGGLTWLEQTSLEPTLRMWPAVHFIDENIGWRTEWVGSMYSSPRIKKTTDGGINWQLQFDEVFLPTSGLCRIKFKNENNGFAVGYWYGAHPRLNENNKIKDTPPPWGLMFYTTDGGANWVNTDSSIYLSLLHPLLLHPLNDVFLIGTEAAIAVGDSGDILFTPYATESWIEQTSGTDSCLNGVYFVDDLNGWVVGDGGTILHTTNGGVSFIEEEQIDVMPTESLLAQNYPNPFNPTTIIQYAISSRQLVTLKVYDVLGNEIETLVNQEKPAGTYEVTWIAASLPSGVYFYQIRTGDFVQTKKMILLK
jgi:photosystem II stability/assembly factor-like uncharacterized protein